MRRSDRRKSQALKHLVQHGHATALALGSAAVAGEVDPMRRDGREKLGIIIGLHFAKRGFARLDKRDLFYWVPPAK